MCTVQPDQFCSGIFHTPGLIHWNTLLDHGSPGDDPCSPKACVNVFDLAVHARLFFKFVSDFLYCLRISPKTAFRYFSYEESAVFLTGLLPWRSSQACLCCVLSRSHSLLVPFGTVFTALAVHEMVRSGLLLTLILTLSVPFFFFWGIQHHLSGEIPSAMRQEAPAYIQLAIWSGPIEFSFKMIRFCHITFGQWVIFEVGFILPLVYLDAAPCQSYSKESSKHL